MMADGWLKGLKLATVMAVAGMGYWGGWWDQLFGSVPAAHVIPEMADSELRSFQSKLHGWNDHQRIWGVAAGEIWQSANDDLIYFEEISQGLILSVRGKSIGFKGDWARWEKSRNRLVLGGNLEVRFDEKQLITAELSMDYHTQKLTSVGNVVITGEDLWIQAGHMTMDLEAESLRLEQGVILIQHGNVLRAKGLEVNFVKDRFELVGPEGLSLIL